MVDRRVIKRPFRVYTELDRAGRNQSIESRGTYISMQITSTLYAESITPANFRVPRAYHNIRINIAQIVGRARARESHRTERVGYSVGTRNIRSGVYSGQISFMRNTRKFRPRSRVSVRRRSRYIASSAL